MARRNKSSKSHFRTGFFVLLLLAVAGPVIAALFFSDARGVPYGWIIAAVWGTITFAACAFGIFYYAQFVLPHHEGEEWWEAVAMILRAASRFGPPPTTAGRMNPTPEFPGEALLPPSFQSLQAGVLPSHLVLALSEGEQFSRAAGPGFVRLKPSERVAQVIDLRRHVRSQELTINTRDGIPLETTVTVSFQVKESTTEPENGRLPYPYNKNAIFLVNQLSSVDENGYLQPWSEQIAPQAATFAVSEFAQFTLDELSQEPLLFNGIERRIKHQLYGTFDSAGVSIRGVKVSAEAVPEQIMAQRFVLWQVPHQAQMRILNASGDEEAMKQFKLARANAQIEIIERIMASIDDMRQAEEASLSDIVALRVVDVLEDASAKSVAQLMLPSRIYKTLPIDTQSPPAETGISNGGEATGEQ